MSKQKINRFHTAPLLRDTSQEEGMTNKIRSQKTHHYVNRDNSDGYRTSYKSEYEYDEPYSENPEQFVEQGGEEAEYTYGQLHEYGTGYDNENEYEAVSDHSKGNNIIKKKLKQSRKSKTKDLNYNSNNNYTDNYIDNDNNEYYNEKYQEYENNDEYMDADDSKYNIEQGNDAENDAPVYKSELYLTEEEQYGENENHNGGNEEEASEYIDNKNSYANSANYKSVTDKASENTSKHSMTNYKGKLHKKNKKKDEKDSEKEQHAARFVTSYTKSAIRNGSVKKKNKLKKHHKTDSNYYKDMVHALSVALNKQGKTKSGQSDTTRNKGIAEKMKKQKEAKMIRANNSLPSIGRNTKEEQRRRKMRKDTGMEWDNGTKTTNLKTKKEKNTVKEINVYEMKGYIPVSHENTWSVDDSDKQMNKSVLKKNKKGYMKKAIMEQNEENMDKYYVETPVGRIEYDNNANLNITTNENFTGTVNFPYSINGNQVEALGTSYPLQGTFYNYENVGNVQEPKTIQNTTQINGMATQTTIVDVPPYATVACNNSNNNNNNNNNQTNMNTMNAVMSVPKYTSNTAAVNYGSNENKYNNTVVLQTVSNDPNATNVANVANVSTVPNANFTHVVAVPAVSVYNTTSPQILGMNKIVQPPLNYLPPGSTAIKTKNDFFSIPNNVYSNKSCAANTYFNKNYYTNPNAHDTKQYKTEVLLYDGGKEKGTNMNVNAKINGNNRNVNIKHGNNHVVSKYPNVIRARVGISQNAGQRRPRSQSGVQNNVFVRTRSLTPSFYLKGNDSMKRERERSIHMKVSPLKHVTIKAQKSLPNANNTHIPQPVCTHEITYSYPNPNLNPNLNPNPNPNLNPNIHMNNTRINGAKINGVTFITPNSTLVPISHLDNKGMIQKNEGFRGKKETIKIKGKGDRCGNRKNKLRVKVVRKTNGGRKEVRGDKYSDGGISSGNYYYNNTSTNQFNETSTPGAIKCFEGSSTSNSNTDKLPIEKKVEMLERRNKQLRKENENLNEMSRLYKNECNRLKQLLVKTNDGNLNKCSNDSGDYDKVNLKLEEENEKLKNQLKALGKSILNSEDTNGVKKILAQQIVDLQEENEKCRNKIKTLRKNNDINHQVLFNLNKTDVSADAMDSIFMQTKNVILEGHQTVNLLYLNMKNLLEQLFQKIRSVINNDEYTKSEKGAYVDHLEEIISENFEELNGLVLKINKLRKNMTTMRAKVFDINRGNPYCGCKPARIILEEDIKHLEAELHKHSVLLKKLRKTNLFLNLKTVSTEYNKDNTIHQKQKFEENNDGSVLKTDGITNTVCSQKNTVCSQKGNYRSVSSDKKDSQKNDYHKNWESVHVLPSSAYSAFVSQNCTDTNDNIIESNKNEEKSSTHLGLHNKLKIIEAQLNALNTKVNNDYGDSTSKAQVTPMKTTLYSENGKGEDTDNGLNSTMKKQQQKKKKKSKSNSEPKKGS